MPSPILKLSAIKVVASAQRCIEHTNSKPDRMIEAIRKPGRDYVFGVQWHPEFIGPDGTALRDPAPILDDFLAAVRKRT